MAAGGGGAGVGGAGHRPRRFYPDFEVRSCDGEAERIGISEPSEAEVLVMVRASERPEDFSANLLAPLLVAGGAAIRSSTSARGADAGAAAGAGRRGRGLRGERC